MISNVVNAEHRVPDRRSIEIRPEPDDHPAAGEPIETRLHGAPRCVETARHLHHGQIGRRAQQSDEPHVEVVDGHVAQFRMIDAPPIVHFVHSGFRRLRRTSVEPKI